MLGLSCACAAPIPASSIAVVDVARVNAFSVLRRSIVVSCFIVVSGSAFLVLRATSTGYSDTGITVSIQAVLAGAYALLARDPVSEQARTTYTC